MAETIQMPKLGFDMAEGTLVRWVKQIGDQVSKGEVLAEIETDKATIEIEASASGALLKFLVSEGDVVPVGADIAIVGEEGESVPEGDAPAPAEKVEEEPAEEKPAEEPAEAEKAPAKETAPADADEGEEVDERLPGGVKASPLARRMAEDKDINLKQVKGTGPGGRIVKRDIEGFTPSAAPAEKAPAEKPARGAAIPAASFGEVPSGPDVEVEQTSKLRSRIASRMIEAKQQVPHFYVTTEMDVDAMLALRKQLNDSLEEGGTRISVNDMIVKAAALTLRKYPNLNSHYYGDKVVRHKRINIGVAVALDEGLMNVVTKDADKASIGTIAAQNKDMIARAREGKVKTDDIEGATFTVSNLGPYDVDHFIAIINPPEAAILAIGAGKKVPVVREDGTLGVGARMKVTISVDHRVSDGAEAAEFLQQMKQLIENPTRLLI
ncbi:MAG: 2-oxo acid dehydrogenase subunit E2 [Anaerolineae bacterium]|nr:2-oxo acid dehydrogenase subunit E2 [Anaerolineae bacterium]